MIGLRQQISADLEANGFTQGGVSALLRGYLTHAGCYALVNHRLARALMGGSGLLRFAGRLLDARSAARTGCLISPLADLAPGIRLPHATGIVIGIGVHVAAGATIYQHVTLGEGAADTAAYPIVGPGAILYAGAKVIGAITIGRGAVVGANAVVLQDVPAGAVAVGVPARIVRDRRAGEPARLSGLSVA